MTLREEAIEAAAEAIWNVRAKATMWPAEPILAEAALDAVLDYLTEHAVDWSEAGSIFHDANVYQLLAALRVQVDTGVT